MLNRIKIFRNLKKDWIWVLINLVGLSTALACTLVIYLFCVKEFSYDRFHSKADQIYRVTTDSNRGAVSVHPARVAGNWPGQLMKEFPAIENMTRLVPYRQAIIKIGDQRFYSQNAFLTDSSFFSVFDFKVLSGDPSTSLSQPGRAFICRSLAMKYFGSIDVVGKELSILHQQENEPRLMVIEGVMEDFPENSHFHAELLTSYSTESDLTTWAYTYFQLAKGTDIDFLRNTIQQKWENENKSNNPPPILYLQRLSDIHLFSHKTREIEKNGDIRSIILLISSVLIILFVAFLNFLNLSRVKFIAALKSMKVKLINGASKKDLAGEITLESLFLSCVSIIAGLFIAIKLSGFLKISVFQNNRVDDIVLIGSGFTLIVTLLAIYPLFTSKTVTEMNVNAAKIGIYRFPIVVQFALAIIAITSTLVLNRQMNFIGNKHPASQNANMVVIADNPWEAVQRYQVFKEELLRNSSISNMTAVFEEPGGDILDGSEFEMEGIDIKEGQLINIFTVDSNFFPLMGIHALAGTTDFGFTSSQQWEKDAVELSTLRNDKNADPDKISELEKKTGGYLDKYILNQSALRLLGISNPEDAIGKRFKLNFFLPDLFPDGVIVGVVPDFHYTNLHNEEKPLAITPRKMFNYCFIICIDPEQRSKAVMTIASVWQKIYPEFPFQYKFITDSYRKVYAGEYAQARVLSMFALISIILSSMGIFALALFSMQRRIKEIGIRKVSGARVSEILVLLNQDYVRWVVIAFIIATPIAYYAMHKWLENFAYKTELSWWIFALAGLLALSIALLTVSWQSWRAATRNPVEALRYE